MDLSIIIVNYKTKNLLFECLNSIQKAKFKTKERVLNYEIIVIDNNSGDDFGDSLKQYKNIVFIQNKKNTGMGAGNNLGIKKAKGDYVVVMNPDTVAIDNVFVSLFEFMEERKDVGVVGPKQLNPDGSVQNSCYRWHSLLTPLFRRTPLKKIKTIKKHLDKFLMKDFDKNSVREVDWLLGSFLFCRKKALEDVGFFDERFFLYFEDTDLCRRFWQKNWKVVYYPKAKIIHNHNRASAKVAWYNFFKSKTARQHILSWLKYLWKWKFKK